MPAPEPLTLHLPSTMLESFSLPRLLSEDGRWSWSQAYALLERFELAEYEREFARDVLRDLTRVWLFRTNQRRGCGDFVCVDMSPPDPKDRAAVVIELKLGEALSEGRGIASPQLGHHREAVEEVARETGIVLASCEVTVLRGDPEAVLRRLGA
ncbi:MAG: hypothetical protein QM765_45725 [Myxococcales bacterium]